MKKVIIIGAGISGLTLAWALRNQAQVTVLEKSSRCGGWIQTLNHEGFLFEQGPRGLRHNADTLRLIHELGLDNELIFSDPAAKTRYLYLNQQLKALSFPWILKLLWKSLFREWWIPKSQQEETIAEFITRRFSSEITSTLIDPLTTGIYAGDCRSLSMKACFPTLYKWEQEHGSVLKGVLKKKKEERGLFSLKGGMESLIHALSTHCQVKLNTLVEGLDVMAESVRVHTRDEIIEADHLYITSLNGEWFKPFDPVLANLMNSIKRNSLTVVNLGYKKEVLRHRGFGYLIPSKEQEDILGTVMDSAVFPQQNHYPKETRLSVMLKEPQVDKAKELALKGVSKHLGINRLPDAIYVSHKKEAIPQYEIGHLEKVKEIETRLAAVAPCITLMGMSLRSVAVNDAVSHSLSLSC